MKKVVIFGNQSLARECCTRLKHFTDYEVVGFAVDKEYLIEDLIFDLPVISFDAVKQEFPPDQHKMLIAVGYVQNNGIRNERYLQAKKMGYQLINLISPKSVVYPESISEDNCIIGHCAVISDSVRIGNNVIVGSGCVIAHDVIIGDSCFLSDGVLVAGGVTIGACSYLGTGAIIRNRVNIGKECVIGAGAILFEHAKDRSVYMGEPAKLLPISSTELPLA